MVWWWLTTRTLYQQIKDRNLHDAIQRCHDRPNDSKYVNSRGWTPLHLAAAFKFGTDEQEVDEEAANRDLALVSLVLDLIKALHEANSISIETPNCHGGLPLHLASSHPKSSLAIVTLVHNLYPSAIEKADMDGHLPLHYAASGGAPLDVVTFLHDKYPNAIKVRDYVRHALPLHLSCYRSRTPIEVIEFLWRLHPSASHTTDAGGETPRDCIEDGGDSGSKCGGSVRQESEKEIILSVLDGEGNGSFGGCADDDSDGNGVDGDHQSLDDQGSKNGFVSETATTDPKCRTTPSQDAAPKTAPPMTVVSSTCNRSRMEKCSNNLPNEDEQHQEHKDQSANVIQRAMMSLEAKAEVVATNAKASPTLLTTTTITSAPTEASTSSSKAMITQEEATIRKILIRYSQDAKDDAIHKRQIAFEAEKHAKRLGEKLIDIKKRQKQAKLISERNKKQAQLSEELALRLRERAQQRAALASVQVVATCNKETILPLQSSAHDADEDDSKEECKVEIEVDAKSEQEDDDDDGCIPCYDSDQKDKAEEDDMNVSFGVGIADREETDDFEVTAAVNTTFDVEAQFVPLSLEKDSAGV